MYQLNPAALRNPHLLQRIHTDPLLETYWSEDWTPAFYIALAHAGLITIAAPHPELGAMMLPQMQREYAVLDWRRFRRPRSLERALRSGRFGDEGLELRVGCRLGAVLERLEAYHPNSWLVPEYQALLHRLPQGEGPRFALRTVELWSRRRDEVVAGELGYTLGRSYTSLSGFCVRDDRRLRGCGTLQIDLLARLLRRCGYAFWNLGHPYMLYKTALGARIVPRARFLQRWVRARDRAPAGALGGRHRLVGARLVEPRICASSTSP